MSNSQDSVAGATRRAQVEAALADYPHLSEDRLASLIGWLRKEASALDVATVASNEALAEAYRRFRADHIDRVTGKDVMRGLLALAFMGAVILIIVWQTL